MQCRLTFAFCLFRCSIASSCTKSRCGGERAENSSVCRRLPNTRASKAFPAFSRGRLRLRSQQLQQLLCLRLRLLVAMRRRVQRMLGRCRKQRFLPLQLLRMGVHPTFPLLPQLKLRQQQLMPQQLFQQLRSLLAQQQQPSQGRRSELSRSSHSNLPRLPRSNRKCALPPQALQLALQLLRSHNLLVPSQHQPPSQQPLRCNPCQVCLLRCFACRVALRFTAFFVCAVASLTFSFTCAGTAGIEDDFDEEGDEFGGVLLSRGGVGVRQPRTLVGVMRQ